MIYLSEPGNRRAWRLNDDQHVEIEEAIMSKIRDRVNSYIAPQFRRMAYITVCKLAGVHHPKIGLFQSTKEIIEFRKIMLDDQTLQPGSYDALRVWSMMLADAAKFSAERLEMINAACTREPRLVSDNNPDEVKKPRGRPRNRGNGAGLRRVV